MAPSARTATWCPNRRRSRSATSSTRELDDVRTEIARLSAAVTEDILRATDILLTQDLDEAERMIVADDGIDAACVALEQRCYRVLALQAPVASDLRRDRGRDAHHRRDRALGRPRRQRLQGRPDGCTGTRLPPRIRGLDPADGRPGVAAVPRGERGVPPQRRRRGPWRSPTWTTSSTTSSASSSPPSSTSPDTIDLPTAVQLAMLARFYERIGDHAVTIGERVKYLVTGTLQPRHA